MSGKVLGGRMALAHALVLDNRLRLTRRAFRRLSVIVAGLFAAGLVAPGSARAGIVLSSGSDSVTVGEIFTIPVSVSGTAGLTSYQFDLSFNPSVLEVLSFDDSTTDFATVATDEGGFLTGITGFIDNSAGLVSGIADSMNGVSGPGLTPGGTIADVTFEALASGTSGLTLSNAFLTDNNNFLSSATGDFTLASGDIRVPEPGTLSLLGIALLACGAARRARLTRRRSMFSI
jgi:hypothetical protein